MKYILFSLLLSLFQFSLLSLFSFFPLSSFAQTSTTTANSSVSTNTPISTYKNPFSVSVFSLATQNMTDNPSGRGSISSYNYLALGYKISPNYKISARQIFFMDTAGIKRGKETLSTTQASDIMLVFADYDFFKIGDTIRAINSYRYTLPTSEFSRAQKTLGSFSLDFIVSKEFGNGLNLDLNLKPQINFQREKTFEVVDNIGNSSRKRNLQTSYYQMENWIRASKTLNSWVTFIQGIGYKDTYLNTDTEKQLMTQQFEDFLISSSLKFFPSRVLDIEIGLSQKSSTIGQTTTFGLYRPSETSYLLITNIRL